MRWIARLGLCMPILLALDAEAVNPDVERACVYWRDVLAPLARRWLPSAKDCAPQMLHYGVDLRAWVQAGLGEVLA